MSGNISAYAMFCMLCNNTVAIFMVPFGIIDIWLLKREMDEKEVSDSNVNWKLNAENDFIMINNGDFKLEMNKTVLKMWEFFYIF